MRIIDSIQKLQDTVGQAKKSGFTIGMVPTMGALHKGHLSLVECSKSGCDITIVSIFLNPTQFNDPSDLEKYPRTFEEDCKLLKEKGVDLVFAPTVNEMYPEPDMRVFSYPPTDTVMEGAFRPGHFNGVCQIVSKLFIAATPDRAYFGEKDFQQIAVIRCMTEDLQLGVEIVPCPVIRHEDGLAMSSRNTLLAPQERLIAPRIAETLFASRDYAASHTLYETKQYVVDTINSVKGLEVQYYDIVNGRTLETLANWDDAPHVVGCITVFCGATPIRLIDHITYKKG